MNTESKTPRADEEEFEVTVQYVGPEKFVSPDFARKQGGAT